MQIENAIQSTLLLDETIIEIEIFPKFEGQDLLDEVFVLKFSSSTK